MLTSLYIHVPFCNQICTYCDFHKELATNTKRSKYIDALIKELTYYKKDYHSLKTIYIGGGTPSSLSTKNLQKLLGAIRENIDVDSIIEYTIESNPNDITTDFVKTIVSYGINRVSLGVQTFNASSLVFLGRSHTEKDIHNAVTILRQEGINNISVDMIYSLINQTIDDLKLDLRKLLALDIDHVSYYALILEEKTKLHYLIKKGDVTPNSEDLDADMAEIVMETLVKNGFDHYEISNFGKNNNKSLHNLTYWNNLDYLGLGTGSHSLVQGKRFGNMRNITKYIEKMDKNDFDTRHYYDYHPFEDEMILGLRKTEGVFISTINKKYKINLLNDYNEITTAIDNDLLIIQEGYLRLTKKGMLLGNEVFQIFLEVD